MEFESFFNNTQFFSIAVRSAVEKTFNPTPASDSIPVVSHPHLIVTETGSKGI